MVQYAHYTTEVLETWKFFSWLLKTCSYQSCVINQRLIRKISTVNFKRNSQTFSLISMPFFYMNKFLANDIRVWILYAFLPHLFFPDNIWILLDVRKIQFEDCYFKILGLSDLTRAILITSYVKSLRTFSMPSADLSPHPPGCRYGRPGTANQDPIRVSV